MIVVRLAAAFLEEERALVELTREQSLLLSRLRRNPRVAVYGCAGSDKTMLAVEHAKRLAAEGRDVLFVCFNRGLAGHWRRPRGPSGSRSRTCTGGVPATRIAPARGPRWRRGGVSATSCRSAWSPRSTSSARSGTR